jgi:hypothetical protein
LAQRLIERLQGSGEGPVLDFGSGSGRNGEALRHAGLTVVAIGDDALSSPQALAPLTQRCAAALSTHGLLHGIPPAIAGRVGAVARCLKAGGLLYATLGSTRDARFGCGERIDDCTFAPADGDERGVAHAYFDRDRVCAILQPYFEIESLTESSVDRVAGAWAHRERPLTGAVHWFAVAHKW